MIIRSGREKKKKETCLFFFFVVVVALRRTSIVVGRPGNDLWRSSTLQRLASFTNRKGKKGRRHKDACADECVLYYCSLQHSQISQLFFSFNPSLSLYFSLSPFVRCFFFFSFFKVTKYYLNRVKQAHIYNNIWEKGKGVYFIIIIY